MGGTSHSFLRLGDTGTGAYPPVWNSQEALEQDREAGGMGPLSLGSSEPEGPAEDSQCEVSLGFTPWKGRGGPIRNSFLGPIKRAKELQDWRCICPGHWNLGERTPTMGSPKSRPRSTRKVVCGETFVIQSCVPHSCLQPACSQSFPSITWLRDETSF